MNEDTVSVFVWLSFLQSVGGRMLNKSFPFSQIPLILPLKLLCWSRHC